MTASRWERLAPVVVLVAMMGVAAVGWRRPRVVAHSSLAMAVSALAASVRAPASSAAPLPVPPDALPESLADQRAQLLERMTGELRLSQQQTDAVRAVIESSTMIGQGNPKTTTHPMTRSECRAIRHKAGLVDGGNPICGAPYMVPIYNASAGETEAQAQTCIDQFEFPNLPCEYPVVYVRANEAAALCEAVGKRICDAHEWEGACAGSLRPPDEEYAWGKERIQAEYLHNHRRDVRWAYGPKKDHALCATSSFKNKHCIGGEWTSCGSNTFPTGAFPQCVSSLGVYDLHGNAAEHMNLPLVPEELASRGGVGWTEMKGSWFIFQRYEAHEDDCRWRAPEWHVTRLSDPISHRNYHLGFRCCKGVAAAGGR